MATIGGGDGPGDAVEWEVRGVISEADGNAMSVDFSPKGGPADLAARWVGDSIEFGDGNSWRMLRGDDRGARSLQDGGGVAPRYAPSLEDDEWPPGRSAWREGPAPAGERGAADAHDDADAVP